MTSIGAAALATALAGPASAAPADPLAANTQYTVLVKKMNGDGSTTLVDSANATTDADGKLTFNFTTMPTRPDTNFIVFEVKDTNSTVRQGIAPAPPENDPNLLGINNLSTVQTKALLAAAAEAGSDDPIMMAYALTLLRTPSATPGDATIIGKLGKGAIIGGFEAFLTDPAKGNVSTEGLAKLKECLIYNEAAGAKTLRDFTESFYNANAASSDAAADEEMQKAGGFMAEMFMDAAKCANIDLGLINAAHNAAGDAAEAIEDPPGTPIMTGLSPAVQIAIEQAMSTFHKRIAIVKVSGEYNKALAALNASGDERNRFLAAVSDVATAMGAVESQYAGFYVDPQAYADAHNSGDVAAAQADIDAAYQTVWNDFMTAMASTDDDIIAMTEKVVAGFRFSPGQLPGGFGKFMNSEGQSVNWPIPQTVMVSWLGDLMSGGGTFSYLNNRDDTTIPEWVKWMGNCTKAADFAPVCAQFGLTWDGNNCVGLQPDQPTCEQNSAFMWSGSNCQVRAEMLGSSACQGPSYYDASSGKCVLMGQMKDSCSGAGGTWTTARTDYASMPAEMGAFRDLLALQEDINIIDFERMSIWQGAGANPTGAEEAAAKLAFEQKLASIKNKIAATTNGTTSITAEQKAAIVKLIMQPSMD
nr:hypothetical protein [Geobacter hydrogenophilus]